MSPGIEFFDALDSARSGALGCLRLRTPEFSNLFYRTGDGSICRTRNKSSSEAQATCTAFCLYYFSKAGLINPDFAPPFDGVLSEPEIRVSLRMLGERIINPTETSTGPGINPYNTPITVAGYLVATQALGEKPEPKVVAAALGNMEGVVKQMNTVGHIPRLGSPVGKESMPSSYLSYWAAAASELLALATAGGSAVSPGTGLSGSDLNACVAQARKLGELVLNDQVSRHHSGLVTSFDVVETGYSILNATSLLPPTDEVLTISRHALAIVFKNYFANGSFTTSMPVLADRKNYPVQCPSVELLALLTLAPIDLLSHQWSGLADVYQWLEAHWEAGWRPETEGRYGEPNAFMTASGLAYLSGLHRVLDNLLDESARVELHVPKLAGRPASPDFDYPESLREVIRDQIVTPMSQQPRSKFAAYSMILYGPPGTSKTSICQKLAQDLGWPLLIVNQNSFLTNGLDRIDAEAERIFRLAAYLKKVVILFDEIEELVSDRESTERASRLITSAMLPRIHHLRGEKRVVFVFATNHLEAIDSAAYRLGRFDIVRCVLPPTADERRKILTGQIAKPGREELKRTLDIDHVVRQTQNFTFPDIEDFVRRLSIRTQVSKKPIDAEAIDACIDVGKRGVNPKLIQDFEQSQKEHDRP